MSLMPGFEIGLWNAWILTLYLPVHPLLLMLIVKDAKGKMEFPAYTRNEKIMSIFTNFVLFFGLFLYSIFLPLQLGTAWFYIGLPISIVGVVAWTIAMVNIAHIPLGEPWISGLYRYSRHPMMLSSYLIFIGAGIASASWIFLLCSIVWIILSAVLVTAEERHCLERYGTAYVEYMDKIQRWIGFRKRVKSG